MKEVTGWQKLFFGNKGPCRNIINSAISQCKYPSLWKMGQITPIFKKDDELVKQNYRPVTVLPCLNNIFEKLLSSQLEGFYNGLLSNFLSATENSIVMRLSSPGGLEED